MSLRKAHNKREGFALALPRRRRQGKTKAATTRYFSRPASTRLPASHAVFGPRVWKVCHQSHAVIEHRRKLIHVTLSCHVVSPTPLSYGALRHGSLAQRVSRTRGKGYLATNTFWT